MAFTDLLCLPFHNKRSLVSMGRKVKKDRYRTSIYKKYIVVMMW